MPCSQQEKGSSFEFFSLLQRDKLWEIETVLFPLPVKELHEYGVYEGDVLFALVHGDKFLIFCMT